MPRCQCSSSFLLSPHIPQPLNMSFPDTCSYYTFRLDPVASLQDIEDEEVAKAARELSPQVYVACTLLLTDSDLKGPDRLVRLSASPGPRQRMRRRTSVPFSKDFRLTARRNFSNHGCVSPSDPTRNIRRAVDLLTAATRCLGMDAITSSRTVRASESRPKCGLSTLLTP